MTDQIDPESLEWWRELEELEKRGTSSVSDCCQIFLELRLKGWDTLTGFRDGEVWQIKINFCPQCGRRLE